MPIDKKRYPSNWEEIARTVKEAAAWRCEKCGIGHMADGTMGSCLTVHHPDTDPINQEARLEALCARCHLKAERRIRYIHKHHEQIAMFQG